MVRTPVPKLTVMSAFTVTGGAVTVRWGCWTLPVSPNATAVATMPAIRTRPISRDRRSVAWLASLTRRSAVSRRDRDVACMHNFLEVRPTNGEGGLIVYHAGATR